MVATLVIHVITLITTDLPTLEGWKSWVSLVGWPIADTFPTKWSHVNHRSCIDMGKSFSQRPTSIASEPRRQPLLLSSICAKFCCCHRRSNIITWIFFHDFLLWFLFYHAPRFVVMCYRTGWYTCLKKLESWKCPGFWHLSGKNSCLGKLDKNC